MPLATGSEVAGQSPRDFSAPGLDESNNPRFRLASGAPRYYIADAGPEPQRLNRGE